MTVKKHLTNCSMLLVFLIAFQSIYQVYGDGITSESRGVKHKGTLKTLESDNGEIIDCVDIYQQPAFDNPLIKDLQMEPSTYPIGTKMDSNFELKHLQEWNKNGECPDDTIPIRRNTKSSYYDDYNKKSFSITRDQKYNQSLQRSDVRLEYVMASDQGSPYYGTQAIFNVWNPKTEVNEFSVSQLWITSSSPTLNTIEAGWIVYPYKFGDTNTHFFIYWTADNYQKTGCYDLDCPGFVQTNKNFAIGATIKPVSTPGNLHEITVYIYRDIPTGNWWLQLSGYTVGYWPKSIFTGLAEQANSVKWGGEIRNSRTRGQHTTTQMGSGHFSGEGYGKSCYIRQLKVLDSVLFARDPGYLTAIVSTPGCYDLKILKQPQTYMETHIYFGGAGFSSTCN